MALLNPTLAYLYAEAQCSQTDSAFRSIDLNDKFRLSEEPQSPNSPGKKEAGIETTPTVPANNTKLAFTLTEETFFDVRVGLVFGSDDERVDVALDSDNSRGVSGRHFSVSHVWNYCPDPFTLMLCNVSTKSLLVDGCALAHQQKKILSPGRTFVRAGTASLTLQVRDPPSGKDEYLNFMAAWECFRRSAEAAVPRISSIHIAESRFDPTPDARLQPESTSVRAQDARNGMPRVHCQNLDQML
ncbi:hypothetical protein KVT40_006655 [Elsinoe batatas]|uniref:FHA domain-containing protein n=1 Tax=Elsinoe batatas TaxID=2601811 RepID=A0A8K0KVX3_9PEZI|nr:hypothetical protein KVT40_006655 [Elsinoe batatas]